MSNASRYCKHTFAFDELVLETADINHLMNVLASLGKPTLRYRYFGFSLPHHLERSVAAHRRILDAFANRDAERAGHEVYKVIEAAGRRSSVICSATRRKMPYANPGWRPIGNGSGIEA